MQITSNRSKILTQDLNTISSTTRYIQEKIKIEYSIQKTFSIVSSIICVIFLALIPLFVILLDNTSFISNTTPTTKTTHFSKSFTLSKKSIFSIKQMETINEQTANQDEISQINL